MALRRSGADMTANTPTIVTFAIYLLGMLLIGWAGYKATSNLSDYILGGRSLGSVVTALSAGASDMSGWLLMGLPGAVFATGLSASWIAIGLCVGAWLNWRFVAARLRVYTEKVGNALTLPDYFTNRFEDGSSLLRIVTALVILVFFTVYCASGVVAGARLFESMFGMDYQTALWVGAVATMAYVFIGGFLAVSWTDTIQASLMITALILAPLMVIYADGGVGASAAIIETARSGAFDMFKGQGAIAIISLLAWGLGYFGQPHILVRFMAAESIKTIPNARRIGMSWMMLCLGGAVAVGFFGIAFFASRPDIATNVNGNHELVFLEVAKLLFNPWISGVLLAAVLAAVMSTLSCQLLVCSSALTQDIYKTFLHRNASQKQLVWFGRSMVFAIALIAILIAQDPKAKVLGMVSNAWAGFGAAFGPLVLISLLWARMTRNGALAGMVVGAVTVLVWQHYQWFKLYEIVPGFAFSAIAIIVVSLLDKAPSATITAKHREMEAEIAAHGE
ncbi:proline:sodium symporter [Comamonas thiooxydans]|uniref:Sodium/proline symporter n=2 Tax=Comamonas thiooxydans TaxID=363952 RepID=A0A0E3BBD3_9BURK|nr:proline:sodium symporter [Comamonas thiooxydans]